MSTQQAHPVDFDALMRLTGQNRDLANELLTMFAAELPEMRAQIEQSHQSKQYEELGQIVHKLHGSCCYCAAKKLQFLAKTTESEIKEGNDRNLPQLVTDIKDEIMLVLDFITNNRVP